MAALEPIARSTLAQQVFDQLSRGIVGGDMEPGDSLPSERELSEVLGVNRGAVREGLQQLAAAGLIKTRHGGGTRVLDFRRHASLDLLGQLLFRVDGTVDFDVARSLMEMRSALAPDIARLCAQRRDNAVPAKLDAIVDQMRDEENLAGLQLLALEFWDVVVKASDNIAYELAFNTLRRTYEQVRHLLVHAMEAELREIGRYAAIAKAIGERDDAKARAQAEKLMMRGLEGMGRVIKMLKKASKR